MTTEFKKALAAKEVLTINLELASVSVNAFPKGEMGLTPDAVKFSEAFKQARKNYNDAAAALRLYNKSFLKNYKKEYRDYRNAR